jgi:hypothetical protein
MWATSKWSAVVQNSLLSYAWLDRVEVVHVRLYRGSIYSCQCGLPQSDLMLYRTRC